MSDNMGERMAKIEQKVDGIDEKVDGLTATLERFIEKVENNFVTNEAFWPVKTIVYSGAGIILMAVVSAIIYLVVKH